MKNFNFLFSLLLLSLIFLTSAIGQQKHSNDWVNPSKTYFKIKVAQDGIYKVTFEELKKAGLEVQNIKGSDLKMINYGIEQTLYVSSNNFGDGQYLTFYGEKNRIGLDSLLYDNPSRDLLNPDYSFVTDTNAYFLTISPETNNKRFILTSPDYLNNTLAPFPYYLHTEKKIFTDAPYKMNIGEWQFSSFEAGEGYSSQYFRQSKTSLDANNIYRNGPGAKLSFRYGQNGLSTRVEYKLNGMKLGEQFSVTRTTSQGIFDININDLKGNNELELFSIFGTDDRHRLANAELIYPRTFDFGNRSSFSFILPSDTEKRLLEITNFKNEAGSPIYLYDFRQGVRYSTLIKDGKLLAIVNPTSGESKYLMVSDGSGQNSVSGISKFEPKPFTDNGQDYIIISTKAFDTGNQKPTIDYAKYRSSAIGGSYKTQIIDIEDIYNHFGYGIDRHFMSIKLFAKYMKDKWSSAKFVFIIGKGIEYPFMRATNDVTNLSNKSFFVPTFGYPGADNLLFSEGNFPDPYFAVGRLAATSVTEISEYLDKIKAYDKARELPQTIEERYWMKRYIHLGGGSIRANVDDHTPIRIGLENMANIISNNRTGAEVFAFSKTSTDAVQSIKIDDIKRLINTGVNMITFFGHSAPGTWDFNIEDPSRFENFGKYPLVLSMGCYSGNVHTSSKGLSERYVIVKDKGAIAFLGSTGTGFIGQLSSYGREFYSLIGDTYYGQPIGLMTQDINKKYRDKTSAESAFFQQQTLHGDPAIRLYAPESPDYILDYNSIKIDPSTPNSSTEEIKVKYDIVNIGENKNDSLTINFLHKIPSGKISDSISVIIPSPNNRKMHGFTIKGQGISGLGRNLILGKIDPKETYIEKPLPDAKINNTLGDGFPFFIYDNSAFPVYPKEFGIVNSEANFILKSSTSNAALGRFRYHYELDTTALFNSPILTKATIEALGGVIEWTPTIPKINNKVYYWRVISDTTATIRTDWQGSSFIYLPGSEEGWNQSHYFQYLKNDFKTLILNKDRNLIFGNAEQVIRLRNKLYEVSDLPGYFNNFTLLRSVFTAWEFMRSGIGIVVNSKVGSFFPLPNPVGGILGSTNLSGRSLNIFPFYTDSFEERKKLIEFIETQIKEEYYISLFTIIPNKNADLKVEDWAADSLILGKNIFTVLEKFGATKVRDLQKYGSVPYLFQAHNGEEGVKGEEIATTQDDIVDINTILNSQTTSGYLSSTVIGPAASWKEYDVKFSKINIGVDTVFSNIYGLRKNGSDTLIYSNVTARKILDIDHQEFPRLKIETYFADAVDKTPAQLDFWRVIYTPLPEAALNANKNYVFVSDTLQEGEQLSMTVGIDNINKLPMDSLLVKFTVVNSKNEQVNSFKRISPLTAEGTGEIKFNYNTKGQIGNNQLIVEMNPDKDQAEAIHANNYFIKPFVVKKDDENPLLNVYFDGVQIMDGDIVSPKPDIKVTLQDDNSFLLINDPKLFEVQLDTGNNRFVTIPYNDPRLKFTPSTKSGESAFINFSPSLKTGEYKLRVQGSDLSGNASAVNQKSINFRVIEKQTISNVLNYPNPFSTSTQFIFTLTGEVIPDMMSITIMTVTGKVVREITKEQLGSLHIGVNRTEYKWDGTDEYGSKLGNGVYLYKVNTRKADGAEYDAYQNKKVDGFFEKGFGKLVIMR